MFGSGEWDISICLACMNESSQHKGDYVAYTLTNDLQEDTVSTDEYIALHFKKDMKCGDVEI